MDASCGCQRAEEGRCPMTAPDLDALEQWRLEAYDTTQKWTHVPDSGLPAGVLHARRVDRLINALLATARRERRLREALGELREMAASVRHGHVGGQQTGPSRWNMTEGTKRRMLSIIDAALAEEGQDG